MRHGKGKILVNSILGITKVKCRAEYDSVVDKLSTFVKLAMINMIKTNDAANSEYPFDYSEISDIMDDLSIFP